MVKLRFKQARSHPVNGSLIRVGAVVEVPQHWANIFIQDGTAVIYKEEIAVPKENKRKKKNG